MSYPALVFALASILLNVTPARLEIQSTADDSLQPSLIYPAAADSQRPLLVLLHHWSSGIDRYDASDWIADAERRDWHLLLPDFRGSNTRPEACASAVARQDILDAVAYIIERYTVDESRIYLAGVSGGGHMALIMAAHAPERWAAVSAWAPITDLAVWHAETKAAGHRYWENIEAVVGGPPGASLEIDAELRFRSPIHHLAKAKDVPIDINTGIHDGHDGSVPIHHTLDAFNALAAALNSEAIDVETIKQLSSAGYDVPASLFDPAYGRDIHLRRQAGPSRVTIFEGGHEGLPEAACEWLSTKHRK